MYTQQQFGIDLKEKVIKKQGIIEISLWAFNIYSNYYDDDFDKQFCQLLLHLSKMELGPEFYLSYEALDKIADDIITKKEVDLTFKSYL